MAAVKFSWRNRIKHVTSFFIGTSPEFDLAIYTLCFLTRQSRNKCKVKLNLMINAFKHKTFKQL